MNKLLKILIPILVILGLVLTAGCAAKEKPIPPPAPGVFKEYTNVGESRAVPAESGAADIDLSLIHI